MQLIRLGLSTGIVVLGILLEKWIGPLLGWRPDFLLAGLLVLALALPFYELILIFALSAFLIAWPPLYGTDIQALGAVVLIVFLVRRVLLKLKWWLRVGIVVVCSFGIFYAVSVGFLHIREIPKIVFMEDIAIGLIYGLGIYRALQYIAHSSIYDPETKKF